MLTYIKFSAELVSLRLEWHLAQATLESLLPARTLAKKDEKKFTSLYKHSVLLLHHEGPTSGGSGGGGN